MFRRRATQSCCTAGCFVWGCPSRVPEPSRTSPCPAWRTWEAPWPWRWQPGAGPAWERSLRSSPRVRGLQPPGCPLPRSWTASLRRSCSETWSRCDWRWQYYCLTASPWHDDVEIVPWLALSHHRLTSLEWCRLQRVSNCQSLPLVQVLCHSKYSGKISFFWKLHTSFMFRRN